MEWLIGFIYWLFRKIEPILNQYYWFSQQYSLLTDSTFFKWLNCLCGYETSSTVAAGRQCVSSSVYPIPPIHLPLSLSLSLSFPLSLSLPVIPTICCLQNKSFIYCHFQDCLYLSSDHYANHSPNRGANYQTIWRTLCFSSFSATFQTMAITSLSYGYFLCKRSGTLNSLAADSEIC